VVSGAISVLAGFLPIDFLSELTSVGTLVAFMVVSSCVIILRRKYPDLERKFKVPFYPVMPILAILGCLWILKDLRPVTLLVFVVWTAAVLLLWWFTGRRTSRLAARAAGPDTDPDRSDSDALTH
jgi:APA family basic amino acid/polyamine antiporter